MSVTPNINLKNITKADEVLSYYNNTYYGNTYLHNIPIIRKNHNTMYI